jgi:hypothetical protein
MKIYCEYNTGFVYEEGYILQFVVFTGSILPVAMVQNKRTNRIAMVDYDRIKIVNEPEDRAE